MYMQKRKPSLKIIKQRSTYTLIEKLSAGTSVFVLKGLEVTLPTPPPTPDSDPPVKVSHT
jgi:hypothetical protein